MRVFLLFLLFCIVLLVLHGLAFGYDCISNTYQDSSSEIVSKSFLAGDKVYLKISCLKLPPGEYSVGVNWVKYNYGTVRQDKNTFAIRHTADREIYFWMKVGKKGLVNRIFSISDYNSDLIGEWTVNSYLNNEPIGEDQFTVN